jgi:hypothetical protein
VRESELCVCSFALRATHEIVVQLCFQFHARGDVCPWICPPRSVQITGGNASSNGEIALRLCVVGHDGCLCDGTASVYQ